MSVFKCNFQFLADGFYRLQNALHLYPHQVSTLFPTAAVEI